MKNGIFRLVTALTMGIAMLQLTACATLLSMGEEDDDPSAYDRGYRSESEECEGKYCDTVAEETPDEDSGRSLASREENGGTRVKRAIETRDIILGMTRQDVMHSWGEPAQREVAGNGRGGHERWTYGSRYNFNGARTVIFEDGKVAGWRR